jgi:hypothetical protein
MEGIIATSYSLIIPYGSIEYNEYTVVSEIQDSDILLF